MDRKKMIKKEIQRTLRLEQKILNKNHHALLEQKSKEFAEKLNEKLPFDAKEKFVEAFRKGFVSVFEKGDKYIEKTYNIEKMKKEYEANIARFNIDDTKKSLKAVEKKAKMKVLLNTSISTIEGAAVGFMGLGTALADVPIFIAVMIKHLNETALHYGMDNKLNQEKIFMLNVIAMSVSPIHQKKMYSKAADKVGYGIDTHYITEQSLKETIDETSEVIAEFITTSKLLQSIPIAGAILGGINNYKFMNYLGTVANIKYKKRYLYKMMGENEG